MAELSTEERDRYRDALHTLAIYLAPGEDGTHRTLGAGCGTDLCVLCAAEQEVKSALRAASEQTGEPA